MTFRARIMDFIVEAFFRDQARPIEWISMLTLSAWLQFLLFHPEEFGGPRYPAFAALSPSVWAAVIAFIVAGQLLAMFRGQRAQFLRFATMTMAAAIWTVIALSFWSQESTAPLSARGNTVLAFAAAVTAVYLGLGRSRR